MLKVLGFGLGATPKQIPLPPPKPVTGVSIEDAVLARRSIREYIDKPLTMNQLSLLLWSAQGITELRHGLRAAPSAGATYPIELYVVVGEGGVEGLGKGVYRYVPQNHSLILHKPGDVREELAEAALKQPWVKEAPVTLVFCAIFARTTVRYGRRGFRYVFMDVGHAAQNVYLMATALGLGTVGVGAFNDEEVTAVLGLKGEEVPTYLMPVGVPSSNAPKSSTFEELEKYFRGRHG